MYGCCRGRQPAQVATWSALRGQYEYGFFLRGDFFVSDSLRLHVRRMSVVDAAALSKYGRWKRCCCAFLRLHGEDSGTTCQCNQSNFLFAFLLRFYMKYKNSHSIHRSSGALPLQGCALGLIQGFVYSIELTGSRAIGHSLNLSNHEEDRD